MLANLPGALRDYSNCITLPADGLDRASPGPKPDPSENLRHSDTADISKQTLES